MKRSATVIKLSLTAGGEIKKKTNVYKEGAELKQKISELREKITYMYLIFL